MTPIYVIISILIVCLGFFELTQSSEPASFHKISPVAVCNMYSSINVYAELDECIHRCSSAINYAASVGIRLMQDTSDKTGPMVTMCHKVEVSQNFTETWTFSTIKGSPKSRGKYVEKNECEEYIKSHCPDHKCESYPPAELGEEYAYASVVSKVETYLSVSSHYGSVVEIDGDLTVMPSFTSKSFILSEGYGNDGLNHFFWDPNYSNKECPLKDGLDMGCDKVNGPGGLRLVCGGSRLAIPIQNEKKLTGPCNGVMRSDNGILYKVLDSDYKNYKGQKIGMAPYTSLSAESDSVRILSQHAIYHVDADVCALQCEVSGLEVRVARRSPTLMRSGDRYMLVTPKGNGYSCDTITHCKLNKPIKVCGSPARFSIHCNGRDYYWNPELNYVTDNDWCSQPTKAEEMLVHIGNQKYSVDKDLSFRINESDHYTHKSRSFLLAHESLLQPVDFESLRGEWNKAKTRDTKTEQLATDKNIKADSLGLLKLGDWVADIFSPLLRVFQHIEIGIIIVLCTLLFLWGLKTMVLKKNRRRARDRRQTPSEELSWI